MAAYFQMGHHAENLVGEKDLAEYKGIVLSPVNRDPTTLESDILGFRDSGKYDIVLDPQLYFPDSERGCLPEQPYFPHDLDSADISSETWWSDVVGKVSEFAKKLSVNAVTSPVVLPKTWTDEYFANCADVSRGLSKEVASSDVRVMTTAMVNIAQLTQKDFPLRIASILSESEPQGYYLVIVTDVDPRRELSDATELLGVMNLIRELEGTGRPVLVSHCSSDMLLFKAAGASNCATGKFFNLRRFTRSRYEEPAGGGGQLAYWLEHSLVAFLRGPDVLRLEREGYSRLIGTHASENHWSKAILTQFKDEPETAWVKLGWRQYLSWFGKTEATLSSTEPRVIVSEWLKTAEENWLALDDDVVLFDEPRNDGKWIRPWRQALARFSKEATQE